MWVPAAVLCGSIVASHSVHLYINGQLQAADRMSNRESPDTGIYNTGLVNFLVHHSAAIWIEMPLRIKKAGGLERGSDDRSASCKIAWYALRYHDQAKLLKPADTSIEKIKHLIAQRERVVNTLKLLTVPAQELIDCGCIEEGNMVLKLQQPVIKTLQKTKLQIESVINKK